MFTFFDMVIIFFFRAGVSSVEVSSVEQITIFVFLERQGLLPSPLTAIPGFGSLGLGEAEALDLFRPMSAS